MHVNLEVRLVVSNEGYSQEIFALDSFQRLQSWDLVLANIPALMHLCTRAQHPMVVGQL